jgi:hypothetical protein
MNRIIRSLLPVSGALVVALVVCGGCAQPVAESPQVSQNEDPETSGPSTDPEQTPRPPDQPGEEPGEEPESPEDPNQEPGSSTESGQLRIRVSAAGDGQRLCPEFGAFAAYSLSGSSAAGDTFPEQLVSEDGTAAGLLPAIDLKAGTWTITVTGLIDPENSGLPFATARGSVQVTLNSGKTAEAAVTLDQTIPESETPGFFTYAVEFPSDHVDSAVLTLLFDNDNEEAETAAIIDLKAGTKSGKAALQPGYYRMKLSLIAGYSRAEKTAILRIHPGAVTPSPRYTFSAEDLPRATVFSSAEALKDYLNGKDQNSPENPYPVAVQGLDLAIEGTLKTLCKAIVERYVDLDLSACSGAEIPSGSSSNYIVSLKLPETVIDIDEGAFKSYVELISIKMPKVNKIGKAAFAKCEKLKSVFMPEVETIEDGATTVTGAFSNCTALDLVDLPRAHTIGSYTFYKCPSLASISLPKAASIGDYVFYDCDSLKVISLPAALTVGGLAFKYCDNLKAVKLPVVNAIGNQTFYNTALECLILGNIPPELSGPICNAGFPKSGIYIPAGAVEDFKSTDKGNWSANLKGKIESLDKLPEEYKML